MTHSNNDHPHRLYKAARSGDSDDEEEDSHLLQGKNFQKNLAESLKSFGTRTLSFSSITYRELKKRPMSYCLGTSSVLVVVFVVALMMTVLANVPAVFMRLGETQSSERDIVFETGKEAQDAQSLNYTGFVNRLRGLGSTRYQYHSPRITIDSGNGNGFPLRCGNSTNPDVLYASCRIKQQLTIHFVDYDLEKNAHIGKQWDAPKLGMTSVTIESSAARRLGVKVGDSFTLNFNILNVLVGMIDTAGFNHTLFPQSVTTRVTVAGIVTSGEGKLPNDDTDFVMLEYGDAAKVIAQALPSNYTAQQVAAFAAVNPYDFATTISMNLPPDERFAVYNKNVYADIQKAFIDFASPVVFAIGFNQVSITVPILQFMSTTRFFSIFLGLLISVIILVLSVLSMVLIYSLMMVNISTRSFEMGVMRMVGMSRWNVVHLVILQAQYFSIPAWVVGLVLAQAAYTGIRQFLQNVLTVTLSESLSPDAIGVATVMGLMLPVIASIAPIMHVLGSTLQSSLDVGRSKASAIVISIERMHTTISWDIVGIGIVLSVFGFLIYYLFPLSLLTTNLALLFYIFFGILVGMLFGMVLLALNAQPLLERVITRCFFFYENAAIRKLVISNLIAHRIRNRKTTVMYSMSLAFIIFITVAFGIQIQSFQYTTLQNMGSTISIRGTLSYDEYVLVENALRKGNLVEGYTWIASDGGTNYITTLGRFKFFPQTKFSVAPNYWEVADKKFLSVNEEAMDYAETDVGLAEYLYSYAGSYRAVVGTTHKTSMALTVNDSFVLRDTQTDTDSVTARTTTSYLYSVTNVLAFVDSSPALRFSQFPTQTVQNVVVNMPASVRQSHGRLRSIRQMSFRRILLKLSSSASAGDVTNAVRLALPNDAVNRITVQEYETAIKPLKTAETVLNAFFTVTTAVAMTMCFYSLTSSMHTNIHEQSKEIGILRAIGMKRFPLVRLYIYEAFVLVISASLTGTCIGIVVAYTMSIQQALFTQTQMPFVFPWMLFVVVVCMGIACSILSAVFPMTFLLKKYSTVEILRRLVN